MADILAERTAPVGIVGVVLAAGEGRRLRPLSLVRPKALCPIGDETLLDRAIGQVVAALGQPVGASVAVNVHHGRDAMLDHLGRRSDVHASLEAHRALGTAGAIGALAEWIEGGAALVVNADTVHDEDLRAFIDGWDRERVRVLKVGDAPFGPRSGVVASIVPSWAVQQLTAPQLMAEPSGLWEVLWRPERAAGRVDAATAIGTVIDCGTPADYLRANLWLSGGEPVIGRGAVVLGTVERSVLWPGTVVGRGERLVDAVRADRHTTVLIR